uniref:TGF-beta family profile domain-containing protein n=1 Tax=Sphaeramia orbicularis TaxID=375764 RepID=A0A672YK76_9TELE
MYCIIFMISSLLFILSVREDTLKSHRAVGSTGTSGGLQPPHVEHNSAYSKTSSANPPSHHVPQNAPCFVSDIFAMLREALGTDGDLRNNSLAQFAVCGVSDIPSDSLFLELAKETSRDQTHGPDGVLFPLSVLMSAEEETGVLTLTFDLPQSPLPLLNPVLLLAFEHPLRGPNMDVTFTSQLLDPNTQTVCISAETQYIPLTGKASEGNVHQKWKISAETKSPDMKQTLKEILIGEESGSNISMYPLLLFSRGTETRSPASHGSFLCELRRFLADVLPRPDSPPISLDSLHSLPPLTIGPSSSESLLAGLMNSSAPTVFSFSGGPSMFQVHRGELALPPALLEELSQRLEQMATHTMEAMKEEEGADRATRSLDRLHSLCVFPKAEPAAGERQYRAFLLLKALQTVARSYEVQRALRATRADHDRPPRSNVCSLRSLTVSLERYLVGPNTAAINNCHGACAFPMLNGNNHAVLLNSHIEGGNVGERAPCCVPVAYEGLEVVDLNEHGTYLTIKPDMVAKECGCR